MSGLFLLAPAGLTKSRNVLRTSSSPFRDEIKTGKARMGEINVQGVADPFVIVTMSELLYPPK